MFSHAKSEVLTSVMAVISYVFSLRDEAILTAIRHLRIALSYIYAIAVERSMLGPQLFSVARPIAQNSGGMVLVSLFNQIYLW